MEPEETFEDAFFWALNYDGWKMHADAMREYLANPSNRDGYGYVHYPKGRSACVLDDDVIHDNPNSILWMCLVMMYGCYGSSPRYGWIEHPDEAAEWLRERQRATYRCNCYCFDDGSGLWEESDEDIAESVAIWERDNRVNQLEEAMPAFEKEKERLQDAEVEYWEDVNHGPLTDSQYAACLRAHARRVRRWQDEIDKALAKSGFLLGKVSSTPRGILSDPRVTGSSK